MHASRRLMVPVLAGLTLLQLFAGVAAIGVVVTRTTQPDRPSGWDPRVEPIARFVADERGSEFEHPVFVDFLDDAEFRKQVVVDEETLSGDERDEIEVDAALLRAVGLIGGSADLLGDSNDLLGAGVIGLYDPSDERIRVRGTELTPAVAVTLAHELTHALQDQLYDLNRSTFESSGAELAFRAIVEGDAGLVDQAYLAEELTEEEAAEAEAALGGGGPDSPDGPAVDLGSGSPPVLESLLSAPYIFGDAFLTAVIEADGADARNRALRKPPTTEEQLVRPQAWLDGDTAETVQLPSLADGEKQIDQDGVEDFGVITWYLMLASRGDPKKALRVLDGWGGDSYVVFRRADRVCVRAAYRGEEDDDTRAMETTLRAWAPKVSGADAKVTKADDVVLLDACDPGREVPGPPKPPGELLAVPAVRTYLSAGALANGADEGEAFCAGDAVLDLVELPQLLDPEGTVFQGEGGARLLQKAAQSCGRRRA